MRAYLIDPALRTVTEVEYNGDYKTIYDLIDCRTFQIIHLDEDCVYLDDEGRFKPQPHWFILGIFPEPLCGKALILGQDEEGDSVEPKMSVERATAYVHFVSAEELGLPGDQPVIGRKRK
jgi:hypothetical protein